MTPISLDFRGDLREARVTDTSPAREDARTRARALKKRGDLRGARAALEEALAETKDPLERAKVEADLGELKASSESLETHELGPAPLRPPPLPDDDGLVGKSAAISRMR